MSHVDLRQPRWHSHSALAEPAAVIAIHQNVGKPADMPGAEHQGACNQLYAPVPPWNHAYSATDHEPTAAAVMRIPAVVAELTNATIDWSAQRVDIQRHLSPAIQSVQDVQAQSTNRQQHMQHPAGMIRSTSKLFAPRQQQQQQQRKSPTPGITYCTLTAASKAACSPSAIDLAHVKTHQGEAISCMHGAIAISSTGSSANQGDHLLNSCCAAWIHTRGLQK